MHAGKSVKEPLPYFNILFFKTIKSNKKQREKYRNQRQLQHMKYRYCLIVNSKGVTNQTLHGTQPWIIKAPLELSLLLHAHAYVMSFPDFGYKRDFIVFKLK